MKTRDEKIKTLEVRIRTLREKNQELHRRLKKSESEKAYIKKKLWEMGETA